MINKNLLLQTKNTNLLMDTSRFFENNFGEYDGCSLLGADNRLSGKVADNITTFLTNRFEELRHVYERLINRKKFDRSHDCSVYTGTCGIVYLAQKLKCAGNAKWTTSLAFTETLLQKAHADSGQITFLCGDAGPLVLGAIHSHNRGDEETKNKHIKELIKLARKSSDPYLDNEILYGRAGYLYALLLVKQKTNSNIIPNDTIQNIVDDLVEAGLRAVNDNSVLPLHYIWYGEEYVGAAHGYVGILYILLQIKLLCPGVIQEKHDQLITSCLDSLLNQRFPSGNMKPSTAVESDKLIHWCRGAPGAIHLYALAYKIFKKSSYLTAAEGFAENVWSRGLLKRGYGICHGVSGNGYAHLCMFQLTNDQRYLWRAIKFAEWCLSYGEHDCRIPDSPNSLFEGMAGTLYFLHDVLNPREAKFPAFQLVTYEPCC